MNEILGLATVFTLLTVLAFVALMCVLMAAAYIVDNWDDFSELVKAIGVVLLVFAFWTVIIGAYKYTHPTAEVEDVRTP
jgi:uncharacterized BrkB/YihY/UPF0761 family membrane protein